jgi:predicted regulator of Ras-like GTPase activity (Roadblock/LC7/MglB family)
VIAILEPLSRLPGVELVMLIAHDGVPIASAGRAVSPADGAATPENQVSLNDRQDGLAALSASWLNELSQAVAPLSWNAPERVCLRAARGTLVLRRAESAVLVVLLSREASPEDVRLSMDGTLARIERSCLGRGTSARAGEAPAARDPELPAPFAAQASTDPPPDDSQTPAEPAKRSHPGN